MLREMVVVIILHLLFNILLLIPLIITSELLMTMTKLLNPFHSSCGSAGEAHRHPPGHRGLPARD